MPERPSATVVLPSKDRPDTLPRVLDALRNQDVVGLDVELLVVDNGSAGPLLRATDAALRSFPWPARLLHEAHPGAAATRNRGVEAARGEVIVFLNDDVVPASHGWLRGHVTRHGGGDPLLCVQAPVTWAPGRELTPVMRYLERAGRSHTYDALTRGEPQPAEWYANNLSLPRALLQQVGGFDDRFTSYGWQEYDLSLRLHDHGMRMAWAPELLAHHDHRHDWADALRRAEKVGATTVLFNALHAGRDGLMSPHPPRWKERAGRALAPVATRIPDPGRLPRPVADRLYWLGLEAAMAQGFGRGRREHAAP